MLLVRAEAIATPATAFEPDHKKIEEAIQASQPGATALNLDQALGFARHIQTQGGGRAGEIAFIGTGRTAERSPGAPAPPRNLRVLLVPDAVENAGLRKIGMRRATADPDLWEIFVEAHNYGSQPRNVSVSLDFGPPGKAGRFPWAHRNWLCRPAPIRRPGLLTGLWPPEFWASVCHAADAFPADDHAELELPAQPSLAVTVYSNEPDLLRPVLAATPRVLAVYRKPAEYRPVDRGLVILDRFIPPQRPPPIPSGSIRRPRGRPFRSERSWTRRNFKGGGPVIRRRRACERKISSWITRWSSSRRPTDGRIAEVEAGPVIVARQGKPKIVVLGFHPALTAMRYELATPLLFANLLRWVGPEMFRRSEISGASVGSVKLLMDQNTSDRDIKVTAEDGSALPFTLRDRTLNFFSGAPGSVRVVAGDREYLYALTLPQLGDSKWEPAADIPKGIPRASQVSEGSTELWPWLAVAGAAGLFAEWLLFGRFRRALVIRPAVMRRKTAGMAGARR